MAATKESLGMTILKDIGEILWEGIKDALSPEKIAKMQAKYDDETDKMKDDPAMKQEYERRLATSARLRNSSERVQAMRARMEQQKAKQEEWERRHSGGK